MRLFGYYAVHSFVNQVRKMLKTWVLIFLLACMLIGGVVGAGVGRLEEIAEEQDVQTEEVVPEEPQPTLTERLGLEDGDLMELAVGVVILGVLLWQCLSADTNGSKIFLPADVNLLFASPMTPQSVLLFRLMTRLGTFIFLGFYLLLQLPNLVLNMGMSLWAALALIAVWCLTVITGSLMQVLLYLISSNHPGMKTGLRRGVYVLIGAVALGWLFFWKRSGLTPVQSAAAFFNASVTRYIPFWGWLKGFFLFAAEGSLTGALSCLAAVLAGCGALLWGIRRTKADFYEDAMAKSEETAALMERARAESEGKSAFKKRKKDRGDSLRRDGMNRGWGAWMFFHKSLYNRFRFAHLGFLTKTMETYLAAGIGVAALCRFAFGYPSVVPAALTIAGLSFFRTLGNPLEQDTRMDFFLLIPESTWAKLFASLLGGAANCLLDALPALLAAALLSGDSVLTALAWLPFIVSIDFYGTCVGAFINLSVPVAAGATIKQVVQIMFIYFGLLPDVALIAVGMVMGHTALSVMAAAVVNCLLGLLFFGLTPLFLEPGAARSRRTAGEEKALSFDERKQARGVFSRLGFATAAVLILGSALQILVMWVAPGGWRQTDWFLWAATFAPLYLVSFPIGWLILRKLPAQRNPGEALTSGRFWSLVPICIFLMLAGNMMGLGVNALLERIPGAGAANPVAAYAMNDNFWLKMLCMVVMAPLMEELLFRRWLIDRMRLYGERLAVVVSALLFGLFHGNFAQFFYAFALGMVFGYVYLRTGRLRYSVALHMFINFLGSVFGPALQERVEMETEAAQSTVVLFTQWRLIYAGYTAAMLFTGLGGLVLLLIRRREIRFEPAGSELPRKGRLAAVFLNPGMGVMLVGCFGLFLYSVFSL